MYRDEDQLKAWLTLNLLPEFYDLAVLIEAKADSNTIKSAEERCAPLIQQQAKLLVATYRTEGVTQ